MPPAPIARYAGRVEMILRLLGFGSWIQYQTLNTKALRDPSGKSHLHWEFR
jgi:hypothetical protein